jgi:hypothetical protein
MSQLRFEVRKDIHDTVDLLERMMTKNGSAHMSLGYLKTTLVDVLMELTPAKREIELYLLNRALERELETQQ